MVMPESSTTEVSSSTLTPDSSTMVLLIDDQASVAHAVRDLLADETDISLHYCPDPKNAIRLAREVRPTVILQDWVLPSIEGPELLQLLRGNSITVEIPIIVLSAEESTVVKSRAFAAGANDYLVKPPDKIELVARIRYHSKSCLARIQRDQAFRTLRDSQQQLLQSNMALLSLNQRLEETRDKLNLSLRESEQHAREAVAFTELVDILQSCQTVEEGYQSMERALQSVLPSQSGALCMTSPSRNVVEAVATWGENLSTEKAFRPDDCWALRRGKVHPSSESDVVLLCRHVKESAAENHVCVPLAAQGETLGVLYLENPSQGENLDRNPEKFESLSRQTRAVGERLSLAVANLRLRDVLRTQSIRDPLTGLFNRRYMEETLDRELRRALRNQQSLSILMMDIDHFKQFNDTFGHLAGDTLLRSIGEFIIQSTRGQDVACRFGGEEFTIVLTATSLAAASKRAELLCQELKHLSIEHRGQVLGRITFSIGISGFPEHGETGEELLNRADQALYQAKAEGRNRIVVSAPGVPSSEHQPALDHKSQRAQQS
jgi:diguanylate cyclase (GGDEF)-like protein